MVDSGIVRSARLFPNTPESWTINTFLCPCHSLGSGVDVVYQWRLAVQWVVWQDNKGLFVSVATFRGVSDADGGIRRKFISSNVLERCPETSYLNPHRWLEPEWALDRLMEGKWGDQLVWHLKFDVESSVLFDKCSRGAWNSERHPLNHYWQGQKEIFI